MATVSATNDIKADVRELADIAIEDKISRDMIRNYGSVPEIKYKDVLEKRLKRDLAISDITGINQVSKRFADKLLFVLSKYNDDEERRLIFTCIGLMVDQATKDRFQHQRLSP